MNFKQFYLLKEDPDYALFNFQNQSVEIDYSEKHYTFVVLDDCIFFTSTLYHGEFLYIIKNYLISNFSETILKNNKVIKFGEVRKPVAEKFLEKFEKSNRISRGSMLQVFPEQLLGRAWTKDINGENYLLVTIWNDQKYYTLKNLDLIKWMAEFLNVNDSEKIMFETNDKQSKNLVEMISDVNYVLLKGTVASADSSGQKPVHELPPEQKKAALIKMGAKPKTPLNLKDKMALNAENSQYKNITEQRNPGKSLKEKGYKEEIAGIYRAKLLKDGQEFHPNDYVTLSKKWAIEHCKHTSAYNEEPAIVIYKSVNPEFVREAGNPGEYFYTGQTIKGIIVHKEENY